MLAPYEEARIDLMHKINAKRASREKLEKVYDDVYDSDEFREEFHVFNFLAPFVLVRRKSTGRLGILCFQHLPRYYFNWCAGDDVQGFSEDDLQKYFESTLQIVTVGKDVDGTPKDGEGSLTI